MAGNVNDMKLRMEFENGQFEKAVAQTLGTLDELKKKIEFKDASKSFDELEKASERVSLNKIADGVESIAKRFTLLGQLGQKVFKEIDEAIVDTGKKFIKSVSTDQISQGWKKYTDQTTAVQTIINATGKDIQSVEEQLSRLAWFTDETSYNFVDMTSNIGKFTSMGIDLETSVTAMEGIATWAAVSGQNAATAGRAMYNMSQAIGVGSVKLMDWRSIENANMATKEFKQTAIDAAKALGKLNKKGKTSKGTLVTFENFSSTLSEGWFTKDVLLNTLEKYGEYADKVYSIVEEKGVTAAEAMAMVNAESMQLGEKAFKAAQEAKTFADAVDAVKDAVSTGWMGIFKNLFGNYEEAKVVWTDLANWLWDVFAAPLSDTNELLARWKELGGRDTALKGIYDIFHALTGVINAVGDAVASIFPPFTVDQLLAASDAIAQFGENVKNAFYWTEFTREFQVPKTMEKIDKILEENNFQLGDQNDQIKALQDNLVRLGLLQENAANGKFGRETQAAIEEYKAGIDSATVATEQLVNTFSIGDKSDEVKKFQEKLIALGYKVGKSGADGVYGRNTEKAFKEYEAALKGTDKTRKDLQRGSEGDDVKELQKKLIDAKLLDEGQADGVFGPNTQEAVKKWQEAHELTATGIVDEETYKKMFPDEAKEEIEWGMETYTEYGTTLQNLQGIIHGFLSVFRLIGTVFSMVGQAVGVVLGLFTPLADAILAIFGAAGRGRQDFVSWLESFNKSGEWLKTFSEKLQPIRDGIKGISESLVNFFGAGKKGKKNETGTTLASIFDTVKANIKSSGVLGKLTASFNKLKDTFKKIKEPMKEHWETFKAAFGESFKAIGKGIPITLGAIVISLINLVSKGFEKIKPWIEKIPQYVQNIKEFFSAFFGTGNKDHKPTRFEKLGLKVRGFIGPFVKTLKDAKAKVVDFFKNLNLSEIVQSVLPKLKDAWQSLKDFFTKMFEGIKGFASADVSGATGFIEKLKIRFGSFKDIGTWFKDLFSNLSSTLGPAWEKFTNIFNIVYDYAKQGFKYILGLVAILQGFRILNNVVKYSKAVVGLVKSASGLLDGATGLLGNIGGMFTDAGGTFKALTDQIKGYKKDSQPIALSLLEFAGAVALIVASIWVIGQMDPDKLKQGLIVVGSIIGVFTLLAILGALFLKGAPSDSIKNAATALLKLSIAIGLLAAIIVLVSFIPLETLSKGLIKLAAIMGVLILFAGLMNLATKGRKGNEFKGFLSMAVAIGILALVVARIANMDSDKFLSGLLRLTAMLSVLVVFTLAMRLIGSSKVKIKGFIGLSIAIGLLVGVVAQLGRMKFETLTKGLAALGVIMGMLSLMMIAIRIGSKGLQGPGAFLSMLGLVAVIAAFAIAINHLEDVDTDKMLKFADSISKIMLAFGGFTMMSGIVGVGGVGASLLALIGIITIAGLVIAAFGGLTKVDGFQAFMESGAQSVGSIIGKIVTEIEKAKFTGLAEGVKALNGVDTTLDQAALQNVMDTVTNFSTFVEGLPEYPSFEKWLPWARTDMELLAGDMQAFAQGVLSLTTGVMIFNASGVTEGSEGYKNAKELVKDFATFINGLPKYPDINKFIPWARTDMQLTKTDMDVFVEGVSIFADGMKDFTAKEFNYAGFTFGIMITKQFANFVANLPDRPNIEKFIPWSKSNLQLTEEDMQRFTSGLVAFSEGMKAFNSEEFDMLGFIKGTGIVSMFASFVSELPDRPETEKLIPWAKTDLELTLEDMNKFSSNMTVFAQGMKGFKKEDLDQTKLSAATEITNTFANWLTTLPNVTYSFLDKLTPWIKTENELIFEDMGTFGEQMNKYATALDGIKANPFGLILKSNIAIIIATQVANFLEDIGALDIETKKSGLLSWFSSSDTTQDSVFDAIGKLGKSMSDNADNFAAMGDGSLSENITKSIDALKAVAQLLTYANDNRDKIQNGVVPYNDIQGSLANIAAAVVGFNDLLKTNKFDGDLGAIAATWQAFADLFNGEKINTKNFLGDLDAKAVATKLTEFTTQLGETIGASTETITGYSDSFNSAGNELASSVISGVGSADTSGAGSLASSALSALSGYTSKFRETGVMFGAGLAKGLSSSKAVAVIAAGLIAEAMLKKVKDVLKIESPSKAAARLGSYFTEGMAQGTTSKIKMAEESSGEVAESMLNVAKGTMTSLSSILSEGINDNPTIRPVVDMTSTRAAANAIDGMFGTKSFALQSTIAASASVNPKTGRPNTNQNGSNNIVAAVNGMGGQISALGSAIQNMKMVVDSGALVGQISNKMDKQLGYMAAMKERMV